METLNSKVRFTWRLLNSEQEMMKQKENMQICISFELVIFHMHNSQVNKQNIMPLKNLHKIVFCFSMSFWKK